MITVKKLLQDLDACNPAQTWVENKNIDEVITQCHRGDWLLWLASKMDLNFKLLTLAKARCAKTVIHIMKDQRSITAVLLAEKFGLTDDVSLEDLKMAGIHADDDAAHAADSAAAAYAADDDAAHAADSAAAAAYATARAAAAAYAVSIENQKQTADICRETFGKEIIEIVNNYLKNYLQEYAS